ncbi:MAG: endolytic transglycosylase MltG [Ruminococcus sp.]|nr:endolytic transglycosylase MltG [Ruminococcus sp.]
MDYENNSYEEREQREVNERRQKKVQNFHLHIKDDDLAVGENYLEHDNYDDESHKTLNSFSGDDVREQMERNSRHLRKREKREEKRQLKYADLQNRRRFRLIWWSSVALVGIMLSMFLLVGVNDMLAMNRSEENKVTVDIPENPTLSDVSKALWSKGVIKEENFFNFYAIITKNADDFTQGTFEMKTNMDYEAIVNYLQSMSNRTDTIKVTVTEGMNVREIARMLVNKDVIPNAEGFLKLCKSNYFDEDYEFIKNIKNADKRYYKLEGYLFPDTYECYHNEDPKLTITRMLNDYESRIYENQNVEGYKKAINVKKLSKESKYSLQQILTMASIIQAEAANKSDMYKISSILHNRLEANINVGVRKLSLDSTKYYPYRSKKAVPKALRKTFKSKYDTYNILGLPPGPICNPGMEAIMAAIYPDDTDYLYFCHAKDGTPYYASTLSEHNYHLSVVGS